MSSRLTAIAALGVVLLATGAVRLYAGTSGPAEPGRPATGSVEGTVRLEVAAEAAPPMLSPYARRRYRPPGPSTTAASASDVVLYVLLERPATFGKATRAAISQRELTIIPRVTVVQTGTRIEFPNRDEVFHNLFSLSDPHPFNLGRYPPGESRSETFGEAGVIRMFCDIHSEMAGVILVVNSPHFARPDESGRFRITGVPAGRHRLVAWHESAGADTTLVVVTSSGVARADFRLPR